MRFARSSGFHRRNLRRERRLCVRVEFLRRRTAIANLETAGLLPKLIGYKRIPLNAMAIDDPICSVTSLWNAWSATFLSSLFDAAFRVDIGVFGSPKLVFKCIRSGIVLA